MAGVNARKCCCNVGDPCSGCTGGTPRTWIVTFDGVLLRTTCLACSPSGDGVPGSIRVTAGTLDGTYTLTQDPDNPCRWLGSAAITLETYYNSLTCGIASTDTYTTATIELNWNSVAQSFSLHVHAGGVDEFAGDYFTAGSGVTHYQCNEAPPVMTNTIASYLCVTGSSSASAQFAGAFGTATLSIP